MSVYAGTYSHFRILLTAKTWLCTAFAAILPASRLVRRHRYDDTRSRVRILLALEFLLLFFLHFTV